MVESIEATNNTPVTSDSQSQRNLIPLPAATPIIIPTLIARERFPKSLPMELNLILGQNGLAYAVMRAVGNQYVLPVGCRRLNNLIREAGSREGLTLRKADIADTNHFLQAHAETTGASKNIWHRVAPVQEGIEIDLGDENHTRAKITAGNVEIVTRGSETLFFRPPTMLPMVTPAEVGDVNLLRKYLNIDETSKTLLVAWISYTLAHPKASTSKYVFLVLHGSQGTGKTSLCNNILSKLIDPCSVGVQIMPRNDKDLAIATQNSHVLLYDNLRGISQAMADNLCITATGGAVSSRQLYTDSEQQVLSLHGAIVFNGIHSFIDQPDLAQRCLTIELRPIPEGKRKSDTELVQGFEAELPVILRGLFDLIAKVFKHLPDAEVTNPERMIDFVRWLAAMEKAHGAPAGAYQEAYSEALNQGQRDSLQDNSLGAAVLEFAESLSGTEWHGTPAELLGKLNAQATKGTQRSREWPQNPIALSKRLGPLQAGLLTQGIILEFGRGKHRTITITAKGGHHEF